MPRSISIPALVLLIVVGAVDAFHHHPPAKAGVRCAPPTSLVLVPSPIHSNPSPVIVVPQENKRTTTVALAAKRKGPDDNKPVKEKVTGLALVLLFLTPWKNPNSIFLYFILIINILAKFNETPQ
jgi:hypothetical protein